MPLCATVTSAAQATPAPKQSHSGSEMLSCLLLGSFHTLCLGLGPFYRCCSIIFIGRSPFSVTSSHESDATPAGTTSKTSCKRLVLMGEQDRMMRLSDRGSKDLQKGSGAASRHLSAASEGL